MKTKFEENVASDSPRPQGSTEPELPWKVSEDDVTAGPGKTDVSSASAISSPPIRIRVLLIVLLIITIFAFISNTVTNIAIDKYEAEAGSLQNAQEASTLKMSLIKTTNQKNALSENASELEKRVEELTAQKELYTAVLETIAKKDDESLESAIQKP